MKLRIKNKLITESVLNILLTAKRELTNGKLASVQRKGHNVVINCPCHKNGLERKPSCSVFDDVSAADLEVGFAHCFTCGYNATLPQVITDLFDESDITFGEEWLVERFGNTLIEEVEILPEIIIDNKPRDLSSPLDESILTEFDFYHPYMWYRKLSKEIVDLFRVGYDHSRDAITFPVYDEKHRLVMITARSVNTKMFWIPPDVEKPVYLLYHLIENNIKTAYVVESQINALYLWSLGYAAIGLFGTGSEHQFEILRKSGIRNFVLMFDGDAAGQRGASRFRKNIGNEVFIKDIYLPAGKDVNDLSEAEIHSLINS